jgi:DNA-binding transcriptional MerR regulator
MEGQDFFEYLELQGSPEMVTKSELLEHVRKFGGPVSDRQLTFYASEQLVPKSVRVGSRAGAYPAVVKDLVVWIVRSRQRGLSVEAIKELVPVWKFLARSTRSKRLDLAELEYVSRQAVRSPEAVFALPDLVLETLANDLCPRCLADLVFVLKDGAECRHSDDEPMKLGFLLCGTDDDGGDVRRLASVHAELPTLGDPVGAPDTVILGVPVGVDVPPLPRRAVEHDHDPASAP